MDTLKRIILFGGSFDPIHTGHVRVARYTLETLNADKLIFIPARRSPHKKESPVPGHHRLAMIQKAIDGIESFSVSNCELIRPEPSYTLDTVYFFREQFGDDVILHWLVGADQLSDFDQWYRVEELLRVCHVSVMVRAGYPLPDFCQFRDIFPEDIVQQLADDIIQTPLIDLNSTVIRGQLAAGTLVEGALPEKVLAYIKQNGLYGYS